MRVIGYVFGILSIIVVMGFTNFMFYNAGKWNATKTILTYCEKDSVYLEQGMMMQCRVIKSDSKN
jgi:hypothetical protein